MIGLFPLKDGDALTAVRSFLQTLLSNDVVDALYVPLESAEGQILPALVTDPARLESANPLAPVMLVNGARAISALTQKKAPARLGAVLRSCETRALVELVKLQQASLEDVLLIGVDCPGTYELADYQAIQKEALFALEDALQAAGRGEQLEGPDLRLACQMCTQPIPEQADIHLHIYGEGLAGGLFVEIGEELAEKLGLTPVLDYQVKKRQQVIEQVLGDKQKLREAEISALQARLGSNGSIAQMFAACLRCHNCMTACPICYCKTCLFRTAAFDHPPEHYLNAAYRKGAIRLLGDTLLFHLTRMNHMAASCVSCGMCSSACPVDIPVGLIFSTIGTQVQAAFGYTPGKDLQEPLPLVTFQANEWNEIGEVK
ncbi:MAG: 4Fe-4S dicluster domain-containing protein [Anaerolineales bacterium]|nr:MAG: 4Fe-4S dicluster domain-containing protein [Anaerolineales bacterium]